MRKVGVPVGEDPVAQRKAGLSELFLGGQALAVESEVADQMTPAGLALLGVQQPVRPPAIGCHDPLEVGAEQLGQAVAVTVLGNPEDRALSARSGPHPAALCGEEPAGLIDVDRPRCQHLGHQTLVRAGQQSAGPLADLIDRADRDPNPEVLEQQLRHVAAGDPVACRQRDDRGLQPRPERRLANHPKHSAGSLPASRTAQTMRAMLGIEDRGRRQLGDLMAPRPVTRNLLALGELAPAIPTLLGVMVNDLLHPVFRQQLAPGARVTVLTTCLTLLTVLLQQFLGFRSRLLPALLPRLRSIGRRWLRTVPRTRSSLLLQHPQPLLQPRLPIHQPHQELDTRLAPRVIDRLSL